MPENTDQEKTEKPTPKKLEKARNEGNIPKSIEVPSVLILLSSLGVFFLAGSWMFWNLSGFMGGIFENAGTLRLDSVSLLPFMAEVFEYILLILMPLMLVILVAGIVGNIIQFGFLFTSKALAPKLSKLNPVSGLKRIVSLKSLVEVLKAIFKFILIGGIAFLLVRSEMDGFPGLMQMSVNEILSFIGRVSFNICFYVCLALIALAVIDFTYQRWQHEKDLRMTKQEVKDEAKQAEGDPKIKGKIRQIQIETARRRMMEQVPEADVVITNPTHLAVALKYEHEKMMAPQIIAKGAGFIAEKIKQIAEENGVPVMEHKALARTLFKSVDLGQFIPANLYRAIAEVLAYVYRLKENKNNI
jgi:flagellar biosynthetic protein FlhB